jgi:hypothetical protein
MDVDVESRVAREREQQVARGHVVDDHAVGLGRRNGRGLRQDGRDLAGRGIGPWTTGGGGSTPKWVADGLAGAWAQPVRTDASAATATAIFTIWTPQLLPDGG